TQLLAAGGSAASSNHSCALTLWGKTWKSHTNRWPVTRHAKQKRWNGQKQPSGMSPMKRAEVWGVNFEPAVGGEVRKERPAVIVSNDISNKHLNRVQVVLLTSMVQRIYPSESPVTLRGKKHKAMADQLTTVSKSRLQNFVGRLSKVEMRGIENAI